MKRRCVRRTVSLALAVSALTVISLTMGTAARQVAAAQNGQRGAAPAAPPARAVGPFVATVAESAADLRDCAVPDSRDAALSDAKDIFVANNWSTSTQNFGGRIAFDRNGLLYLTVGDRMEQDRAQKTDDHGGKVLRLRDDGSVPPDNPFVGKAGYAPEIYSLGHRSEQGLALNPATGAIWENEHGPQGGDELNISSRRSSTGCRPSRCRA